MQMSYFGDSYDVVKQSLLRWLRNFGEWSVHPMFTEPVARDDVKAFESLLGATVISTEVFTVDSDRASYLSCGSSCGNLLMDPDTGLRMRPIRGAKAPKYLFAHELQRLAEQRPGSLTVVFDQSVGRGSESLHLEAKLGELYRHSTFAFGYASQACFIVAGQNRSLVESARERIIAESRLPWHRILQVPSG